MIKDNTDIGALIKSRRIKKGMMQEMLAEQIGKNQQDINRYENNRTSPKKEVWSLICKLLDIPLDAYFSESKTTEKTIVVREAAREIYFKVEDKQVYELIKLISKEKEFIEEIELARLLKRFPNLTEERKKLITNTLKNLFKLT